MPESDAFLGFFGNGQPSGKARLFYMKTYLVRRHIVRGANRTLISGETFFNIILYHNKLQCYIRRFWIVVAFSIVYNIINIILRRYTNEEQSGNKGGTYKFKYKKYNVNKKYADKILKQQKTALISIYSGQDILNRPDLFIWLMI